MADWTKDGSPAHICRGVDYCDDGEHEILGCGLLPQYRGRGTAIPYCPGWLRTMPLWGEIQELFDSGIAFGRDWPHKMLPALREVAVYRAERMERLHGDS